MSPLFFDAYTEIGPRNFKHPAAAWSLAQMEDELAHCSISGALVASTMAVQYDAMHGNRELSTLLAPHPHLFAIWHVLPHIGGEFPAAQELAALMVQHDVRAVSLNPRTAGWDLHADSSQPLLCDLAGRRTATLLKRSELAGYGELDRLLERHPQLPLILTGASWREQRLVWPLLHKHRNLHLTFEEFQVHYGIEDLVAEGCEDQLLFASRAPIMAAGAHRAYIDWAEISPEAKAKVAGGNLVRLLQLPADRVPRERINHSEDRLMAAARAGNPLPVPVLDMHMHILHEGLNGAGGSYRMARGGPRGVHHLLQRLGCMGGGFMSWNGTVGGDSQAGNACTSAALDASPPGFWGLGSFDPTHYSQSELSRLIPQIYADRRFIGMKPYLLYGVPYDHPSYDIWWRYGEENELYAGLHRTRDDFSEVANLAAKYPRVRWVVYHCGSDFRTADMAIETMLQFPNVYAEITLTPVPMGIVDYLVAGAGAERILYGSDLPMRDPRQQLGWVVFSRLSASDKERLLWRNALQVIAPCLSRLPAHCHPLLPKNEV